MENKYLIPSNSIFYIHGKACDGKPIVLGHATDPDMFLDESITVKPPEDISEGDLELWYEEMSSQHDPIYEGLVSDVNGYFLTSFKDTHGIIEENEQYFKGLTNTNEILIYGHSMSDVDMPYLKKIASIAKPSCIWIVSYYEDNEKEDIESVLEHLNISSDCYNLIKLSDFVSKELP